MTIQWNTSYSKPDIKLMRNWFKFSSDSNDLTIYVINHDDILLKFSIDNSINNDTLYIHNYEQDITVSFTMYVKCWAYSKQVN